MAKDKFKEMQQKGGGVSTFQQMAEQAATVAAIEQQNAAQGNNGVEPQYDGLVQTQVQNRTNHPDVTKAKPTGGATITVTPVAVNGRPLEEAIKEGLVREVTFMRLPNPQIPIAEYNLVSRYCEMFSNITRQDFVELAIVEKLHNEQLLSDDDFKIRLKEIHNRPPRGHRRGTKTATIVKPSN